MTGIFAGTPIPEEPNLGLFASLSKDRGCQKPETPAGALRRRAKLAVLLLWSPDVCRAPL